MKNNADMLCSRCQIRPAEVFMTSIVGGKKIEEMLCLECALQKEEVAMMLSRDTQFKQFVDKALQMRNIDLNKLIPPMAEAKEQHIGAKGLKLDLPKDCPICGCSAEQLIETREVGCDHCYEVFDGEIDKLLKLKHSTLYKGKRPVSDSVGADNPQQRIIMLKEQLKDSIRKEQYEQAGRLRAEIAKLEAGK